MPSAKDALSGDTKTFESRCAALIVFQSANEKSFGAPSTLCSAGDSDRGSAVRAGARAGRRRIERAARARGERHERRHDQSESINTSISPLPLPFAAVTAMSGTCLPNRRVRANGHPKRYRRLDWGRPVNSFILRGDFPDLTGRATGARLPPHPSKSQGDHQPATNTVGGFFFFRRRSMRRRSHELIHVQLGIGQRRSPRQGLRLHRRLDSRRASGGRSEQPRRLRSAVQERTGRARRRDHVAHDRRLRAGRAPGDSRDRLHRSIAKRSTPTA